MRRHFKPDEQFSQISAIVKGNTNEFSYTPNSQYKLRSQQSNSFLNHFFKTQKKKENGNIFYEQQSINRKPSVSIINNTNVNFAIQSEPNQLKINLQQYFNQSNQTFQSATEIYQLKGAVKIFQFLENFDRFKYIQRLFFIKLKEYAVFAQQQYKKSMQQRQLQYMNIVLPSRKTHNILNSMNNSNANSRSLSNKNNQSMTQSRAIQIYHQSQTKLNGNIKYCNKIIGCLRPNLIQAGKQRLNQQRNSKMRQLNVRFDEAMKFYRLKEPQKGKFNFVIYNHEKYRDKGGIIRNFKTK